MKKLRIFIPFSLTAFIILLDQISKALVVKYMPLQPGLGISKSIPLLGDLLRLTHIRNTAILFSIGQDLTPVLKLIFFIIIPLLLLVLLVIYYLRSKEIQWGHRWILAAILGGGIGNMLDRIIRPDGVVDFIDMTFFGIFGLSRWPTYNFADASIVISAVFLIITIFSEEIKANRNRKRSLNEQKN